MCLDNQLPKAQQKRILGTKSTVTCWKVVATYCDPDTGKWELTPLYYGKSKPFKRDNSSKRLLHRKHKVFCHRSNIEDAYLPYFHLFLFKKDAKRFLEIVAPLRPHYKMLKCKVGVNDITTMGKQGEDIVVVAKKFSFFNADKYFGKKESHAK